MIKAILFDFDGVIADSIKLVTTTESAVLKKFGIELSPLAIEENYGGMGDKKFFGLMVEQYKLKCKAENLQKEKFLMLKEKIHEVQPIEGVLELINMLHKNNFKLAVGSGSPRYFIEMVLDYFGVKNKFQSIVSADDVEQGKPYPDIFLKAAKNLGVEPKESIVIEDSLKGMQSAKAAGIPCIGLVTKETSKYPADIFIKKLSDLSLGDFLK